MNKLLQLVAIAAGAAASGASVDLVSPFQNSSVSSNMTPTVAIATGYTTFTTLCTETTGGIINGTTSLSTYVETHTHSQPFTTTIAVTTSTEYTTFTTLCTKTISGISNGTTSLSMYVETHTHSQPFTTTITLDETSTISNTLTVIPTATIIPSSSASGWSPAGPMSSWSGSSLPGSIPSSYAVPSDSSSFQVPASSSSPAGPESYGSWSAAYSPACDATQTFISIVTTTVTVLASNSQALTSSLSAPYGTGSSTSACALPTSPLTVEEQVGGGTWGTLCQPYFPKWLNGTSGQVYTSAPWGNATTTNSDATVLNDIPNTGMTRSYDLTISRGRISTDGVLRDVIMVNGQFPAPALEANWGDCFEVTVHNNIENPTEGTSLHWHGMLQRTTPWYDGVPSVGQCPIAPGSSFTYRFQAELYGSSWYHAHYSAQYTAGVAGPMIVHGPTQLDYDIDVGPVMVSDWHHIPYFSVVEDVVGSNFSLIPPFGDSILINGRARFDCSSSSYDQGNEHLASAVISNIEWTCVDGAEYSAFRFQSGKTHRLRFVNHGSDGIQKISIDGHQMTVIATDFVPTVPYTTSTITLGVGQRTDVLVTANDDSTTAVWLRSSEYGGVPCDNSPLPDSLAAIYYEDADTTVDPTTTGASVDQSCTNDILTQTVPEYAIEPATDDVYVANIVLDLTQNSTGDFEWQVNGQAFRGDYNSPNLFLAAAGNVSYPYDPQWNVYNYDQNKTVILNVTNNTPVTHPFHMHGHNFYVLNFGPVGQRPGAGGVWDGSVINSQNPTRRDTQIIGAFSYAAIQFDADNPGVWPFHCHVAWHLSGGLAMNILSRPEDIPPIPSGQQAETCTDWYAYSNANVVDQIDAGS